MKENLLTINTRESTDIYSSTVERVSLVVVILIYHTSSYRDLYPRWWVESKAWWSHLQTQCAGESHLPGLCLCLPQWAHPPACCTRMSRTGWLEQGWCALLADYQAIVHLKVTQGAVKDLVEKTSWLMLKDRAHPLPMKTSQLIINLFSWIFSFELWRGDFSPAWLCITIQRANLVMDLSWKIVNHH